MTEEIFRADPYARTCAAVVVAADGRGMRSDGAVFYPAVTGTSGSPRR